jgi:hypothetical protein
MTPSTPPKGSLEDLFRFHLLESEAAAVTPRPQVWEQVDTQLLLAQNEKYRRRLAAYRWAVAASLLLASLAGGGWWHSQGKAPAAPTLAQATTQPASQAGLATARRAATAPLLAGTQTPATGAASASLAFPTVRSSAIDLTATPSASAQSTTASSAPAASRQPWGASTGALTAQLSSRATAKARGSRGLGSYAQASGALAADARHRALPDQSASGSFAATAFDADNTDRRAGLAAVAAGTTSATRKQAGDDVATDVSAQSLAAAIALAAATNPEATAEATLAARLASLTPLAAGLPSSLAEVAVAQGPPLELARRWQYGASYSASAYNPNIDWGKPVVVATSSVTTHYPASFTRSVASEYRDNLRAGLGQRLSLWATRRLGNGRWGLRTGLELAQNTATSASSVAFVGEPVADLSYLQASYVPRLQRTSYRYRSVSVPAELRYSNPLKTGFSFYGRIGAMVTALLNVRSDVEGTPEATRTYSLASASTPYRHVSAGLRGGAGMQYRPAGRQWALNFGPVAEMGILSLNADPSQDFWTQQRPYSFGLEAGMELGRGFRLQ